MGKISVALVFIFASAFVSPILLTAQDPPADSKNYSLSHQFKNIDELNEYIEKNWGNESARQNLYTLAVQGMKDFPDNAEIIGRVAWLEYLLQKADLGAEKIAKAYQMNPANWAIPIWAFNIYCNIAHHDPDKERSILFFKKAMEVNKDFTKDGYFYIGYRFESFDSPKYREAVENFNKAAENGYNDISLYIERANCYLNLKKYSEAETDLNKALDINKNNSSALYTMATLRMVQDDVQGWAMYLEKFLALPDDDFVKQQDLNVRSNLFNYYVYNLYSLKNAVRHLEYLINTYPDNKDYNYWNSLLERYSGRNISVTFVLNKDLNFTNICGLPVQNSFQTHSSYTVDPKPKASSVYSQGGNTFIKIDYDVIPKSIEIITEINFQPRTIKEGGFVYNDKTDDPRKYLEKFVDSGVVLDPDDTNLKKLVNEIIGNEKDTIKKARLIQSWIIKNITYKVVCYDSIQEYLKNKFAECGGFALIFTALCRAAGIPARRVFSPIFEYPDDKTFGSHETSEFYADGAGWIPVNNTGDQFGLQTDVLALWRTSYSGDNDILYPELKNITVKYKTRKGKLIILTGG